MTTAEDAYVRQVIDLLLTYTDPRDAEKLIAGIRDAREAWMRGAA